MNGSITASLSTRESLVHRVRLAVNELHHRENPEFFDTNISDIGAFNWRTDFLRIAVGETNGTRLKAKPTTETIEANLFQFCLN